MYLGIIVPKPINKTPKLMQFMILCLKNKISRINEMVTTIIKNV